MEHSATAPDSPMFMRADPLLTEQLVRLIALANIDVAIETGVGGDSWALVSHLQAEGAYV